MQFCIYFSGKSFFLQHENRYRNNFIIINHKLMRKEYPQPCKAYKTENEEFLGKPRQKSELIS
jgi:hypothetical protein